MTIGSLPNATPGAVGLPSPANSPAALEAAASAQANAPVALPPVPAAAAPAARDVSGFSNFLQNAIGEVDSKLKAADGEQTKVLTGETNNIHQAVIAVQEANVAFSLMIEVRNKLVDSYQELMRVQV